MTISRRRALKGLAAGMPAAQWQLAAAGQANSEIQKGPFEGARESLARYEIPEWFRDAKFGIWAHWGPQSVPEDGDWYARNMYLEGSPQYKFHLQHYGHPSRVGFKDVIAKFKADRWDPEHLMDLYKKAGARYFVSMGVHHDNFDMWNSKYQKRWNAAVAGPKKDIVGRWRDAARKRGLRFGVSEHLSNSFDWLAPAHRADKSGEYAGVKYDGSDPDYSDLYHDYSGMPADFMESAEAMGRVAPDRWKQQYFNRIKDLIDQHQPDLLYTDGAIPFDSYGLSLVAHHYNVSAKRHGGRVESVYTSKGKDDCTKGTCALDLERGVVETMWPRPWQTDTCIGAWHYKKDITYKSPKIVLDMLVDIVSRNGNLLLNFPLPGSGELDSDELEILDAIGSWMKINGEAIYNSRPWVIYGEGPSTMPSSQGRGRSSFNERGRKALTAQDIRFTRRGSVLYAFIMGWSERELSVQALGLKSPHSPGRIHNVEMLGHRGKLKWKQDEPALRITPPREKPGEFSYVLKVSLS
jgi:alpha-L-fucosidase